MFFGRNDAKAETPVLWPPYVKSWLTGKDSDAGRDWGQEKKGTTEDEMAGWHHWLDGRESEWTLGVDGQGGLACWDSWGHKESDTTDRLNWIELKQLWILLSLCWEVWSGLDKKTVLPPPPISLIISLRMLTENIAWDSGFWKREEVDISACPILSPSKCQGKPLYFTILMIP